MIETQKGLYLFIAFWRFALQYFNIFMIASLFFVLAFLLKNFLDSLK